MTTPVPQPAAWPLLGNILDIQGETPLQSLEDLTDTHGPIVKLYIMGSYRYIVSNYKLFDELCDETRFFKLVPLSLAMAGPSAVRGLFAQDSEKGPDWQQAHRILMPAFGPMAIEGMFEEMHDIATQMIMKWARMGPDKIVALTEDFTRLTLDTIALCSMDYRFNSFYSDSVHPYVEAMNHWLLTRSQSMQVGHRLKLLLQPSYAAQLRKDVEFMQQVGKDLVDHRRAHPTEKRDLLNSMIHGKDPKTGETMRDELIAANMQTFLVAGHETTSGLLSFAFIYMLMNPSTFLAAQKEVDEVVGVGRRIELKHLQKLPYIEAVLRETLRLSPTAPAFARGVRPENKEEHVIIGGKYEIPRGANVLCLLRKIHRDPSIYGEDADAFRPERMLGDRFEKLPKNAWRPFGTGLRACIGRAFAWQEAVMVTAMILQNFQISLVDPDYKMQIHQNLTIKPKNAFVHIRLRDGITATKLLQQHSGTGSSPTADASLSANRMRQGGEEDSEEEDDGRPLLSILYGSNTGTCLSLALSLAREATDHGYRATLADLDSAVNKAPRGLLVVVTSSYEGQPPDNAARFVAWLQQQDPAGAVFKGVRFAVFGCGHKDWPATHQAVPKLLDELLETRGGRRVASSGFCETSSRDMASDFAQWTRHSLWPAAEKDAGGKTGAERQRVRPPGRVRVPSLAMQVNVATSDERGRLLQQKHMFWATVAVGSRRLTTAGEPEKRHLTLQLPVDVAYETGDYLAVLPLNQDDVVRRVLHRFELTYGAMVTIHKGRGGEGTLVTSLPVEKPISVVELLRGYVELSEPATKKDILILAEVATDAKDREQLKALTADAAYADLILSRRTSLLDLLEKYGRVHLPLASFLAMLPAMRPRQYSIASSPRVHGKTDGTENGYTNGVTLQAPSLSLCYTVLEGSSWSCPNRRFHGVSSTYMQSLQLGDQVLVAVRPTNNRFFRMPADPTTTPMVMICAGAGLAPFMGFLEERAVWQVKRDYDEDHENRKLAPALLFIGCRGPVVDRLYADQLDAWERAGIVSLRYAFSRQPDHERAAGCRRVPERLRQYREELRQLWAEGGRIYVCGSTKVAEDVGTAVWQVLVGNPEKLEKPAPEKQEKSVTEGNGETGEAKDGIFEAGQTREKETWLQEQSSRVVMDVFS